MADKSTLPANTLSIEHVGKQITLIVTCDTAERAQNMYDEVCADARDGYVMFDLETKPKLPIDMQTLPRERRDD